MSYKNILFSFSCKKVWCFLIHQVFLMQSYLSSLNLVKICGGIWEEQILCNQTRVLCCGKKARLKLPRLEATDHHDYYGEKKKFKSKYFSSLSSGSPSKVGKNILLLMENNSQALPISSVLPALHTPFPFQAHFPTLHPLRTSPHPPRSILINHSLLFQ